MRISTIQAFNNGVQGMQNNYSNVTRTQEQISSGKRIMTPADDPVGSVRLLQLDQQAGKLEQYKGNLTAANNSLMLEEATLGSVNNILQRIREIALEAGNGALDKGGREALAQELAGREEELFGLMNSKNARGEYLFGGYMSENQPFVREANGSYKYEGDEGQRFIDIAGSTSIAINDNGKDLFVDVLNVDKVVTDTVSGEARISIGTVEDKNAYDTKFYPHKNVSIEIGQAADGSLEYEIFGHDPVSADGEPLEKGTINENAEQSYQIRFAGVVVNLDGELADGDEFTITRGDVSSEPESEKTEKRSLLESVRMLREELETGGDKAEDKLQRRDVLSFSLQNIDNAMNKVLGVQTSIGARMNVIESTQNEHAEVELINTTVKSGIEDLDYAEALSRLSLESVVLQAAQQSFVKISGMSLFNLLR
ncbi:flagellar hook-associated protein FlgL [Pseudomonas profundi]|uniref:flagellar hook-associated protein FlgL n=1 Tax=Pseudomonas profundi TaxID=1981513 RepID=UPI00123B3F11|nr:flagellar hook-associated protein FlgL [Pseudomonas profundi]